MGELHCKARASPHDPLSIAGALEQHRGGSLRASWGSGCLYEHITRHIGTEACVCVCVRR